MNRKRLLSMAGVLLIMLLISTIPASANPNWINAEIIEIFCDYQTGEWWIDGEMYYERGSIETGYKIPLSDDDPFPNGTYIVDVNLDLNLATGEGNGFGEAYFYPEDSEEGNYFVGWWHGAFYLVDGVWIIPKSHSNTDGVGDLEGWRTKSKSYLLDPSEYAGYCSGRDPFGVQFLELDYKKPK